MRLAYLGEAFGSRPSEYLSGDLEEHERFYVDEAALIVLAQEKKAAFDKGKETQEAGRGQEPSAPLTWGDASTLDSLTAQSKAAKRELLKNIALAR